MAVVRGRPHHSAHRGSKHQQPDAGDQRCAKHHHEQPVVGKEQAHYLGRTGDGRLYAQRVGTKGDLECVFKHHGDAEGQQQGQGVPVFAVEDPLYQAALGDITQHRHQQWREHQGPPERQAQAQEGHGQIGADGIELTMRHVDDVQQTKDDGQAQRHQHHSDTDGHAIDHLRGQYELQPVQDVAHAHVPIVRSGCRRPGRSQLLP